MTVLTKKFFERPTLKVASDLLGKFLCCKLGGQTAKFMITEVEAYDGPKDKASHAHKGKTARNTPMFGEAGVWYVYFVYGMYNILNIVTGPENYPAAVLIRSVAKIRNSNIEIRNKSKIQNSKFKTVSDFGFRASDLSLNGPGKLTKVLGIDKRFNAKFATPETGLWIESASWRTGFKIKKSEIKTSPRVGVNYAGEWKDKHYRFYI